MSFSTPSPATLSCSLQQSLQVYIHSGRLAEIVYQSPSGDVCVVHESIRDLLSRAGRDFLVLGAGRVLAVDHIIMIDGRRLAEN